MLTSGSDRVYDRRLASWRFSLVGLLILALAPLPAQAADGVPPMPRCPAQPGDVVFLPCDEVVSFQPMLGVAITPYAGKAPPTDGPLLDLTAGNRALRSSDGLLDAELRMITGTAENPMLVGSRPYRVTSYQGQNRLGGVASSYNGVFPAPTLMIQPGDTLRLMIRDERIPDAVVQASALHFDPTEPVPQASNLHTHGLLVGPSGEGDNVYRAFLPGNRYRMEMRLGDSHTDGMNWYHPHMHGSTAPQVFGGLAGLIQVGGVVAPRHRTLVEGLVTRQLVFSGLALAPSAEDPDLFVLGPVTNATSPTFRDPNPASAEGAPSAVPDYRPSHLINGQLNPTIAMRPNETQVWTAANFNVSSSYSLAIVRVDDDGTVDPATPLFRTTQLGQDGNDLYTPVEGHLIKHRDPMADFTIGPGVRLTWTVTAPEQPGTYYLINAVDRAYTRQVDNLPAMLTFQPPQAFVPTMILATVAVEGDAAARAVPAFDPTSAPRMVGADPVVTRQIAFDFDEHYLRGRVNFGYFPDTGVIQSYSGDVETWIVSTYSQVAHPIHIHQGDFIVERIAYYEDQALTRLRRDLPENPVIYPFTRVMDTLTLPGRSKVQLRLRASAFPGKFVMHCHMLLHEDSGMMASVAVSRPRQEEMVAVGAGPGSAPLVSLVQAASGAEIATFHAFDRAYRGGVSADVGNPLGGYRSYVAVAPRQGLPAVRLVDPRDPVASVLEIHPFGGSGDGATVALGDIDGDGVDEVVIGSGPGTRPSVAVYDVVAGANGGWMAKLKLEVPVFDASYGAGGVRVAVADIDGDNWDDIAVANGPGVRNRLSVLSGRILSEAARGTDAFATSTGDPLLDRDLKLSICAATGQDSIIADRVDPLPGSDGLNLAAGMLGAGFATYPPVAKTGINPMAAAPYRAQIALTRAAVRENPEVAIFEYTGPSVHEHGNEAGDPRLYLRPVGLFTPFPGQQSHESGLALATGLTTVADPNTPITALVSALDPGRQAVSYFDIGGGIVTKPWASRPQPAAAGFSSRR